MSARDVDAYLYRYIQLVRKLPVLSREEEHELALHSLSGCTSSRKRLIESNLRHVVAIALQHKRYGVRIADLIGEGAIGLMMAAGKFDPHRGTRFVTYAGYWIRAYVLDHVVRSFSLVGCGSGALRSKVFFRLRREHARVAQMEHDHRRRVEILAEKFEVTPEKMEAMLQRVEQRDVSLDNVYCHDSESTLLDTLPADQMTSDDTLANDQQDALIEERLRAALTDLDLRERFIVEQRMMSESEDELSLAAIGRRLGVSRERARQLEARARKKLQRYLEELEALVA